MTVREFLFKQDAIEYAGKKGGRVTYDPQRKEWLVTLAPKPRHAKDDLEADLWT